MRLTIIDVNTYLSQAFAQPVIHRISVATVQNLDVLL